MMSVKEVSHDELKYEFAITVPLAEVEQALTRRLEDIGKTAKIQGFRPGKAPLAILRQRFGAAAREEVLDKTVSESVTKALSERNLRPAVHPQVEMVSAGEGKDVEFKLAVEVLPEIAPVREALIGGDPRLLYLAWLACVGSGTSWATDAAASMAGLRSKSMGSPFADSGRPAAV